MLSRLAVLRGDQPDVLAPRIADVVVGAVGEAKMLDEPASAVWSLIATRRAAARWWKREMQAELLCINMENVVDERQGR